MTGHKEDQTDGCAQMPKPNATVTIEMLLERENISYYGPWL